MCLFTYGMEITFLGNVEYRYFFIICQIVTCNVMKIKPNRDKCLDLKGSLFYLGMMIKCLHVRLTGLCCHLSNYETLRDMTFAAEMS